MFWCKITNNSGIIVVLTEKLAKKLGDSGKRLTFETSECRQRARNNMFEEHDFKLDLSDPHNEGIAKTMVMPSVFLSPLI